jgi:hypothetical protein
VAVRGCRAAPGKRSPDYGSSALNWLSLYVDVARGAQLIKCTAIGQPVRPARNLLADAALSSSAAISNSGASASYSALAFGGKSGAARDDTDPTFLTAMHARRRRQLPKFSRYDRSIIQERKVVEPAFAQAKSNSTG